jgi:serine/threonine-protein kinase
MSQKTSDLPALLSLLDEALDLSLPSRAERVAALKQTTPHQAAELEALLAAEERLDRSEFLTRLPEVPLASASSLAGMQLGGYTLERPLGRGGMGTVWMARRTDGRFDGVVAVKLLHLALLDALGAARFRREGTVLARLSHPNIARLLDAGVNATGQPYLVLEYVDGERIDAYCDAARLPVEGRLRLFLQVLDAVAHAHANLIVHRDLKPSNILVRREGEVKLLDFGIAKLLGEDGAAAETSITEHGSWALTPDFAAPEQVTGGAVTTATDVYALGVVLYLLLTGRHPTSSESLAPAERLAAILEAEPQPASAAVMGEAALTRGNSLDKLRRIYSGDLDNILTKALRKDPALRYGSVAAFADDIRRYLTHQPVNARPDTLRYRAAKFVRRHRAGVVVGTALGLLLIAGGWRERDLRQKAEIEARKAQEVGDFLVSVFDAGDPFAAERRNGADITARELLDAGTRRVDSGLVGQTEVQAQLRNVLGRAYTSLGLYDRATELLRQSLDQHLTLHGPNHLTVAEDMERLGDALLHQDKYAEAEPLLRDALAMRRDLLGSMSEATAHALDRLATLHQRRDEYAEAEPLFREALAIRRRLLGDTAMPVARSLNNLGVLLYLRGAYAEAESVYSEALAIDVRTLGELHPRTAQTLHNLAQTQQSLGKYAEAETQYRRALDAKRKGLGDLHPSVTVNLNNLASVLIAQGKLDEAEPLIREALKLDRQLFGDNHSYVGASLRSLGRVLRFKGELAEAEQRFRQALAISQSVFGAENNFVAVDHNNVGVVRALRNDMPGAVQSFRQALAIQRKVVGDDHINTIAFSINLGRALHTLGENGEADSLLRAAATALDTTNAAHRPWYANAQTGLALVDLTQGRTAEAVSRLERAVDFSTRHLGDDHVRTHDARLALGKALIANGQPARAEALLRAAAAYFEKNRKVEPVFSAQAAAALGELKGARAKVD